MTRLTVHFGPADSPRSSRMEITTDGVRSRTRYLDLGADELALYNASDGTMRVRCDSSGCLRFEVVPEPSVLERRCPDGKQTGTGEFIGRRTTNWTCTQPGDEPREAVFDAEFPDAMLKATLDAGYLWEAESFEVGVQVPDDFFSLDRPDLTWVKPKPTKVTPPKPGRAGATMPAFGGGTIRMTDYTKGPALIVFGGEDELRSAFARIERVRGGSRPTLVGVLQLPSGPEEEYLPKRPFGVPVALAGSGGEHLDAWLAAIGDQVRPTAVLCRAAGDGCTAVAIPELSDAALTAEIATVG